MSDAVTLLTLRTRVRRLGDLGADATTGRWDNASINRELNIAWRLMREKAALNGNGMQYLKSTTGTLTQGVTDSSSSFGVLALPADCVHIAGLDVKFSATDIRSLEFASWQDRNQFDDIFGNNVPGRPVGFCVFNIGVEAAAAITAGSIAIFPAPDSNYAYKMYYLPVWAERTLDTDVFDAINGHQNFAVATATLAMLTGDNDSSAAVNSLNQMKVEAEQILTKRANTLQRVGPSRRRPVREQSNRNRARSLWRLP